MKDTAEEEIFAMSPILPISSLVWVTLALLGKLQWGRKQSEDNEQAWSDDFRAI